MMHTWASNNRERPKWVDIVSDTDMIWCYTAGDGSQQIECGWTFDEEPGEYHSLIIDVWGRHTRDTGYVRWEGTTWIMSEV